MVPWAWRSGSVILLCKCVACMVLDINGYVFDFDRYILYIKRCICKLWCEVLFVRNGFEMPCPSTLTRRSVLFPEPLFGTFVLLIFCVSKGLCRVTGLGKLYESARKRFVCVVRFMRSISQKKVQGWVLTFAISVWK